MSHTATETDPTPFDAEAYRVRYGVREYLRYVSNIESEQKAWTLVSYLGMVPRSLNSHDLFSLEYRQQEPKAQIRQ